MKLLRVPLLARIVTTLAAAALLPLLIGFYQLRTNKDALLEQVQRTHIVAASTAASRVADWLASLRSVAVSTAANPVIHASPQSPAARELLRRTLQARPDIAALGLFDSEGAPIVLAPRTDMKGEIASILDATGSELSFHPGGTKPWLRVAVALPEGAGELVLVAAAEPLERSVIAPELGDEADLILAAHDGETLFSTGPTLSEFPSALVARAASGSLAAGATKHRIENRPDLIVAHYQVEGAPWYVLSRQSAAIAEVAQSRIRRATWVAVLGAMLLTILFSSAAHLMVVRPLRRITRAQRELAGLEPGSAAGSEIKQLESSFASLEQRLKDREDLGNVFLGRYEVVDVVASGSMGTVFRGWDPKLQRAVALKTIRISSEEIDRDRLRAHLVGEAKNYARFSHPNIVTIYDILDHSNTACIAMELVNGVSLQRYLAHQGAIAPTQLIPLAEGLAAALVVAHRENMLHHDVKPGNVLLGHDGSVKMTDFGISQLVSSAVAGPVEIRGTAGYLAPESLQRGHYDTKSDLFALGTLLYECLAGEHPFCGRDLNETITKTMTEHPPPLAGKKADIPQQLDELIARLIAKDPLDRPTSAEEVVSALGAMSEGEHWAPDSGSMEAASKASARSYHTQVMTVTGFGVDLSATLKLDLEPRQPGLLRRRLRRRG